MARTRPRKKLTPRRLARRLAKRHPNAVLVVFAVLSALIAAMYLGGAASIWDDTAAPAALAGAGALVGIAVLSGAAWAELHHANPPTAIVLAVGVLPAVAIWCVCLAWDAPAVSLFARGFLAAFFLAAIPIGVVARRSAR